MTVLPVLAVGVLMGLVAVLWVLVSIVLILVILVQKGRGGGLSAAFGGGMGGGLLGSKTGDFLTWVTIVLVAIFLMLAVLMARFFKPSTSDQFDAAPQATQLPADVESSGETPSETMTTEPNAPDANTTPAVEVTVPDGAVPAAQVNVSVPDADAADTNSPG